MSTTTFNGTLDVTIADAQINISQLGSKQDPYCIVTLGSSGVKRFLEGETFGKEKFETKVHNNAGQHPIWNETHSMSLKNMTLDSHLKIKLWDKDIGRDDSMGIAKINLSQLLTNDKKGVQYYPIYKKSKLGQPKSGQIGQIGVGVIFNCTEKPQFGDLKTQTSDAMHQKQQGIGAGPYQSTQPSHTQQPYQPSYTQQPIGTTTGTHMTGPTTGFPQQTTGSTGTVNPGLQKPFGTQGTIPQTNNYGQVPQTHFQGQQYQGQQYQGQQYQGQQ